MKYNKNSRKSWDVGITIQSKKLNNERKKRSRSSNWVNDEKKKLFTLETSSFQQRFYVVLQFPMSPEQEIFESPIEVMRYVPVFGQETTNSP